MDMLGRLFGTPPSKQSVSPADLRYILGLKWNVNSKAEINELAALEDAFASCGIPGVLLEKVEAGYKDISFWFFVDNPKRAFKSLASLPMVSERLKTLQAAAAERANMKFSVVYPK